MSALFAVVVAVDPFGHRRRAAVTLSTILVVATLAASHVLSWLSLSPEAFWIAAGIVLLIPGTNRLLGSGTDASGPAAVLVAIACATRDGTAQTLVALVVASALTLVVSRHDERGWVERIVGALMVVVALDLIRDGVIAV